MNSKGQPVLKFSKKLIKQIDAMKQKNYVPKLAKIRFIVYWQKENSEYEIRIVLPELYFERTDDLHVY
jgi:ATP-dependent DNA helicase RecQ